MLECRWEVDGGANKGSSTIGCEPDRGLVCTMKAMNEAEAFLGNAAVHTQGQNTQCTATPGVTPT